MSPRICYSSRFAVGVVIATEVQLVLAAVFVALAYPSPWFR